MSTIMNDRDVLLQASLVRDVDPAAGKLLILTTDTPVFQVSTAGAAAPSAITVTARLIGLKGVLTWSCDGATSVTPSSDTLSATLAFSAVTAPTASITAQVTYQGVTYIATQIVAKVTDGQTGINTALVYAYKRASAAPTDNPGDVTVTFASSSITTPAGDGLANGWKKTMPAGDDPLYVTVATASSVAATDNIGAAEWAAPVLFAKNGISTASITLYQRATSTPAVPAGDLVYTFVTGALAGALGSWSRAWPAGTNPVYAITATALSTGATDTIATAEWSAPVVAARNGSNGSSGDDGQRGSVTLVGSGSSWTDAAAMAILSANGYSYAVTGDIVTITNGTSFSTTKFYAAGAWYVMTAYINGNLLVSGTIAADKIISGSTLSGVNIVGGTLNIGSGQLTVSSGGAVDAYNFFGHTSLFGNLNNPGAPSVTISNTASSTAPALQSTGQTAIKINGRFTTTQLSGGNGTAAMNSVVPIADNAYTLGGSGYRWSEIWGSSSSISTSDARTKTDIVDSDLGLEFIRKLRPVSFLMAIRKNNVVVDETAMGPWPRGESAPTILVPEPGHRRHYGFVSQEVKQALADVDASFWVLSDKDDPDSTQALRYEGLIAPLTKALLQLDGVVLEYAERIENLETELAQLRV